MTASDLSEAPRPTAVIELVRRIAAHFERRAMRPTVNAIEPVFHDAVGPGFSLEALGFANFTELYRAAGLNGEEASPTAQDDILKIAPRTVVLDEVFGLTRHVVERLEHRDQRPLGAVIKPFLRDAMGGSFKESDYGFRTFGEFARAAAEAGYVSFEQSEHDFLLRTVDVPQRPPGKASAIDTEGERAFETLLDVVSNELDQGESTFAGRIKPILKRAYNGDFDEHKLGYTTFGDFLEAAEERGYVRLQGRPGQDKSVTDIFPSNDGGLDFSAIRFGYSSASAESVRNPRLLLEGFYDPRGLSERLQSGPEFLVLGYKGSGKSAVGEHLLLLSDDRHDLFVDLIDLRDFPLESLRSMIGQNPSQQLLQGGWTWLLLVRAFQSILSDEGALLGDSAEAHGLANRLRRAGLLPTRSVRALSMKSAELTLSGGLPGVFSVDGKATFETSVAVLDHASALLRDLISDFQTPNRHLLIIDGVDELLTPDPASYTAMAALVGQVNELNNLFFRHGSALKIVMMCRSDLYERLPNLNKNKIRQDFTVHLRWYDPSDPERNELERLILQRAQLSGYRGNDPLRDYLPRRISIEDRKVPTVQFLLAHTRHTPRDLVSVLTSIQRECEGPAVSYHAIRRGLAQYSVDYFLPELKDELHGYLDPQAIEDLFGLLGSIGKRVFTLREMSDLMARRKLINLDPLPALQILFECSALGQERSTSVSGRDHRFRYEHPNLAVNPDAPFIIHRGAWRALNLEEE
jgi:Novel STAND NTPase 1/OST-HTH/LOTUS domain